VRALIALTALITLLCSFAASADAMRCGSHLIHSGDTRSAVRDLCGEPADVTTRSILRRPTYYLHGSQYSFGDNVVEIPVEIWTYNFGPYRLMRRIRFVDGLVEEIETLGYGYRAPAY